MTFQIDPGELVYKEDAATWHPIARHAGNRTHLKGKRLETKPSLPIRIWRAVQAWYRHREARAAVEGMLQLDDATLRDIGLNRYDVEYASRLPLSTNAAHELKLIAIENRKAKRL